MRHGFKVKIMLAIEFRNYRPYLSQLPPCFAIPPRPAGNPDVPNTSVPNQPAQRLGGFTVKLHFPSVINTRASGARMLNAPDVGWSGNG